MKITEARAAADKPNPHGVSAKPIYDSPHAQVVHMTLLPGQSLKRHATPVDVFFYVLEGSGVVEIGDERQPVGRDMIIESPARIPHALANEGTEPFRVLVVKVPKPTEATKVL
ncbi:MAG TPA: cupin domain-containing protein [Anaeromyxobacteraceae bacterium]|nr:cupin domain-containing protein [Anaeromyxobacteraceae bacterium]